MPDKSGVCFTESKSGCIIGAECRPMDGQKWIKEM